VPSAVRPLFAARIKEDSAQAFRIILAAKVRIILAAKVTLIQRYFWRN
jgi:hypothetical protein